MLPVTDTPVPFSIEPKLTGSGPSVISAYCCVISEFLMPSTCTLSSVTVTSAEASWPCIVTEPSVVACTLRIAMFLYSGTRVAGGVRRIERIDPDGVADAAHADVAVCNVLHQPATADIGLDVDARLVAVRAIPGERDVIEQHVGNTRRSVTADGAP